MVDWSGMARLKHAFVMFRDARAVADHFYLDLWQCALEKDFLESLGAKESDLRSLVAGGFLTHAHETSSKNDSVRRFKSNDELDQRSCFVMPESTLDTFLDYNLVDCTISDIKTMKPKWDFDKTELRFGGQLIKKYSWRAPNQERLISAFQSQGWPVQIDNPLEIDELVDTKRRLHDTIKCLNRRFLRNLIRFHGDGTGKAVQWRLAKRPEAKRPDNQT